MEKKRRMRRRRLPVRRTDGVKLADTIYLNFRVTKDEARRLRELCATTHLTQGECFGRLIHAGEPWVLIRDAALSGEFGGDLDAQATAIRLVKRYQDLLVDLRKFALEQKSRLSEIVAIETERLIKEATEKEEAPAQETAGA